MLKVSNVRFATILIVLGGTLALSRMNAHRSADVLVKPLDQIPTEIDGWSGEAAPRLSDAVESRLLATAYLTRTYRQKQREMSLLVTYYAQQNGGESMHSPKNCLPGAGWEAWDFRTVTVPGGFRQERVNLYSIQKDGQRMQVLYWYQSRSRIIANEYAGKAWLVWDALSTGKTGGTLVRLMMPDRPGSVGEGVRFASRLIPEVQRCLGRVSTD